MPSKAERYAAVAKNIANGSILSFDAIFVFLPQTVLRRDMAMNHKPWVRRFKNPKKFSYEDTMTMAQIIGCEPKRLADLIWAEIANKTPKKKPHTGPKSK